MTLNESGPGATVSASGVPAELVETFDEWVEQSRYESRSEALRDLMRQAVGNRPEFETPLEPPRDDALNHAYKRLVDAANNHGTIRHETALRVCTNGPRNLSKPEVEGLVLNNLRRRGYLQRLANLYGDAAWKLRGVDR